MAKKRPVLFLADQHALAAFFAMHHGALLALDDKSDNPEDVERVVVATFGLVAKKGPYRLTERGKRAMQLAQYEALQRSVPMKQLKGIIINWKRANGRIEGTALYHADGTTLEAAMLSPNPGAIANGHGIFTSPVLGTVFGPDGSNFQIVETHNSYYVLLGKEQV